MRSSLVEKLSNLVWEYKLGIRTRGISNVESASHEQIHYASISYRSMEIILNHLQLGPSDTFVDLGSGKGRMLCCAAIRKLRKVIGVECVGPLAEVATKNADQLRGKQSPIEVLSVEAQKYDYSIGTAFYMFHPFGPKTMREVLAQLKRGLQRNPRDIRIAYVNPEHNAVLRECSWLEEYEYWTLGANSIAEHEVSWWKNNEYGS